MHGELTIGRRGTRDTGKRVFTTARTELLVHFLGGEEAGMAALDEGLQVRNSLKSCRGQKIQVHLQQNVLTL